MANIKKNLKWNKKAISLASFLTSFIIIILAIWLLLGFILTFTSIQNPSHPVLNNDYGLNNSFNRLNNTMNSFNNLQKLMYSNTTSSNPDPLSYVFLIFRAGFDVPKAILDSTVGSLSDFSAILFGLAGHSTLGIVLTTGITMIFAGLTIILVLLVIQFIRQGVISRT